MKKIYYVTFNLIAIAFVSLNMQSCMPQQTVWYYGTFAKVNFNPELRNVTPEINPVVVVPTKSNGNPNETFSDETTAKFISNLQDIGINVVGLPMVEAALKKFGITKGTDLTVDQMKAICNETKAKSIFITTVNSQYIAGQSTAMSGGYARGGVAGSSGVYTSTEGNYFPVSESAYLIDPFNGTTYISARVSGQDMPLNHTKGMAYEIVLSIWRYWTNTWPEKQ